MSKRQKNKQMVKEQIVDAPAMGLTLGQHQFRTFEGIDAAFGARRQDYPAMADIPEAFKRSSGPYQDVFSSLFFRGGKLEDFGLSVKPGLDRAQVFTAIRSLMCSFDPQHEHKTATVAWALSEWCNGTPKAGA